MPDQAEQRLKNKMRQLGVKAKSVIAGRGKRAFKSAVKKAIKACAKVAAKSAGKVLLKIATVKALVLIALALKTVLIMLAPFLLGAALIGLAFGGVIGLLGAIGAPEAVAAEEIRQHYEDLAQIEPAYVNPHVAAYNLENLFLVDSEGQFYPNTRFQTKDFLACHMRHEHNLVFDWALVHSFVVQYAIFNNLECINDWQLREMVAAEFSPYFYYKPSKIITVTEWYEYEEGDWVTYQRGDGVEGRYQEDGEYVLQVDTRIQEIYLLVEGVSVFGHWLFEYKKQETMHEIGTGYDRRTTTVTREVLYTKQQILVCVDGAPSKHQRFKDFIAVAFDLDPEEERQRAKEGRINEIDLLLTWITENAAGFRGVIDPFAWMLAHTGNVFGFVNRSMVCATVIPIITDVSEKHNIPVWIVNAVILNASSFDSHRPGGLFALSDVDWDYYSAKLGFDPVRNKMNPRAQVEVGVYLLRQKIDRLAPGINWDNEEWQEYIRPVFGKYGFCVGVAIETALGYRDNVMYWPVPGHYYVSSPFGYRIHPVHGDWRQHRGIDIPAPIGTPIVAAAGGIVYRVEYWPCGGHVVIIRGGLHEFRYLHLAGYNVRIGQKIHAGEVIAFVGVSGEVTGAHLCFQIRKLPCGKLVDPEILLFN